MRFSTYDVKVEYFRGGRVRCTHLPSGHVAESSDQVVATLNRDAAMRELLLLVETDPALGREVS